MPYIKTKTITCCSFKELNEKAKEKAITRFWDINVDYDWWKMEYESASEMGFKIEDFDIDRASYCKGKFIDDAKYYAEQVKKNFGVTCDEYKRCEKYLNDRTVLEVKARIDNLEYDSIEEFDEYEELNEEFLKATCEEWLDSLRKQYEYLTSKEAIIETIECNEYEFDEEGKQI